MPGRCCASRNGTAGKNTPAVTFSNPYFKGTKAEKEAQIRRMASLLGVDCDFCHNEDLTVFFKGGKSLRR